MGDMEYILAFQRVVMPIAYEYNPELILVSAGFDAAIGDPLGGCKVTPEAYGYFTHWLSSLAAGRVILCLEGGYNVNSVAYAMTMCTKALLGDPLPMLQNTQRINASCIETIQNVLSVQQKYWKSLRFNKKLPSFENDPINDINKAMNAIQLSDQNTDKPSTSTLRPDDQQAGPSSGLPSTSPAVTLSDFLAEQRQALDSEEMFAVYPLTNCPHLSLLESDPQLTGKFNFQDLCLNRCTNIIFFF